MPRLGWPDPCGSAYEHSLGAVDSCLLGIQERSANAMKRLTIAMLICASAMSFHGADAQTFSARRMAMGGVVLGGNGANVAYRAVPQASSTARSLSLPLGLIPLLADPPQLDSSKPD